MWCCTYHQHDMYAISPPDVSWMDAPRPTPSYMAPLHLRLKILAAALLPAHLANVHQISWPIDLSKLLVFRKHTTPWHHHAALSTKVLAQTTLTGEQQLLLHLSSLDYCLPSFSGAQILSRASYGLWSGTPATFGNPHKLKWEVSKTAWTRQGPEILEIIIRQKLAARTGRYNFLEENLQNWFDS